MTAIRRSQVATRLRPDLVLRPSPGIRFDVAQRGRSRAIAQVLVASQLGFAVVGLVLHGIGSLAVDPEANAVISVISAGLAVLLLVVVRRVRNPRRLEVVAFLCVAMAITAATVAQVENASAGHAAPVYQAVAIVFVSVAMPWRVRTTMTLVALTATLAFAGIASTLTDPAEAAAFALAITIASVVAVFSAVITWNRRVDRWQAGRRILALNAALALASRTDGLTGLGNRHALEAHFARLIGRRARNVAFAIIDVDRFKAMNDEYGHLAGDDVLRMVARMVQAGVRPGDRVYRYGGEEILVVFEAMAPGAVAAAGERIREAVLAPNLPNPGSEYGTLTASIGTASMAGPATMPGIVATVGLADRRLYAAKAAGRNCVVSTDEPSPAAIDERLAAVTAAG